MRNPSHACGVDFFIGIVFLHIMRSFYFSSISSFKSLLHYNAFAPLLFPQLVGCEFSNLCFLHHSIFFCLVSDTLCIVVVSRNTIFCSDLGFFLSFLVISVRRDNDFATRKIWWMIDFGWWVILKVVRGAENMRMNEMTIVGPKQNAKSSSKDIGRWLWKTLMHYSAPGIFLEF